MVGFRHILSSALVAGLIASGVAAPAWADSPTVRTFTSGELCSTSSDGLVTYDAGAITINIGKLDPAVTDVVIGSTAISGCAGFVTSLAWVGTHPLASLEVGMTAFYQSGVGTLTSVSFPAGLTALTIGDAAFAQTASVGSNTLASVTFPAGLATLDIGEAAFKQVADSGGNRLEAVEFPAGLSSLSIGISAFQQSSGTTSNRLATVTFPESLSALSIGSYAFRQDADAGVNRLSAVNLRGTMTGLSIGVGAFFQYSRASDNALKSVSFPTGLTSLTIGEQAFGQSADLGTNALTSVSFPAGLTSLDIRDQAFWQWSGAASGAHSLAQIRFPGNLTTLVVGQDAFRQQGGAPEVLARVILDQTAARPGAKIMDIKTGAFDGGDPTWYWFGPDQTNLADAWNGTINGTFFTRPTLRGYRRLTFLTSSDVGPGTWYVYPGGGHTTTPQVPERIRFGTTDDWTVPELPSATRAGFSFGGWCPPPANQGLGRPVGPLCLANYAGEPFAVVSDGILLDARWTLLAPVITASSLAAGQVTYPYQATLPVSGAGTLACEVTAGSLPPGVTMTGCALAGTPTTSGSFSFTVTASNEADVSSQAFTVTIAAAKKFTKVYKPKIAGTARVGKTLKASVKTWKPKPTTVTWQWKRNGVAIPGATKSKYKLTKADKGKKITVTTVRTRLGYKSSSTSKPTSRVK
jgi:hypothetical protein